MGGKRREGILVGEVLFQQYHVPYSREDSALINVPPFLLPRIERGSMRCIYIAMLACMDYGNFREAGKGRRREGDIPLFLRQLSGIAIATEEEEAKGGELSICLGVQFAC